MKTSVTLLSPDRELFGVKIRQQSKSGHLSLSDLQGAYALARQQYGWSERNLTEVLNSKTNAERIFYLLSERGLVKLDFSSFMEEAEKQGVVKLLKGLAAYKTTGRAANRSTWCDPYVWTLVAMEMNPMLYAKTVTWLTDSLLLNRIEAGDLYRGLAAALSKFGRVDFKQVARALNFVVFGQHRNGIRDTATAGQLNELAELEKRMAWAIEDGFIRTQEQLLERLRAVWTQKFNQRVLVG